MRTLCLNLPKNERPNVAETFLAFSPRVHYRSPGLVFVDVDGSAGRFGGESGLLHEVERLTDDFFPGATAALADTPAAAQLLSRIKPFSIARPQGETEVLRDLPLSSIVHLEGLVAWRTIKEIENVIDFFYGLGVKHIGDLRRFSSTTLSERFGTTGTVLWRRLHGQDRQVILPLIPHDPLSESIHFGLGVSLLPLLLHSIEKSLQNLLMRLEGRLSNCRGPIISHQVPHKILLHLYCEFSDRYHLLEIQPETGHRDLQSLMQVIENQLADLDLSNPIKEVTLEMQAADSNLELNGVAKKFSRQTSGFLKAKGEVLLDLPEDLYDDHEDRLEIGGQTLQLKTTSSFAENEISPPEAGLSQPLRLSKGRFARYKLLSTLPIEKVENGGWDTSRGRTYYLALSPEGSPCWIYHDQVENEHYRL